MRFIPAVCPECRTDPRGMLGRSIVLSGLLKREDGDYTWSGESHALEDDDSYDLIPPTLVCYNWHEYTVEVLDDPDV